MEDIEPKEPLEEKVKKPRTEKQLESFKKACQIRDENRAKRKEETNKLLEDKIVQKAISIKKTQLTKMKVLDEIPDNNTPIEKIKEIVSNNPIKQKPIISFL